jgi:glycosyltransferase involved in cell wall biosynthesis
MRLSIVTVCRNAKGSIARTISSVITQKTREVEYLIIDGSSTDGTQEIVREYGSDVDYFVSEPDGGIYQAMNKGLQRASGDFVWFLNADDQLYPGSISFVLSELGNNDFLFGLCLCFQPEGDFEGIFWPVVDSGGRLNDFLTCGTFIPHPALICKTVLARDIGFDDAFHIAADYDFMIRLVTKTAKYLFLRRPLALFQKGGISERQGRTELFAVQKKNFSILTEELDPRQLRNYYRFLVDRSRDPFYSQEKQTIQLLKRYLPVWLPIKILILLKSWIRGLL